MKKILLVEPDFPIPPKSKNHKNFLPIGLLKLYDYFTSLKYPAKLVRGNKSKREIGTRFYPKEIMITSLFTYWSEYVKESVEHYRKLYPKSKIIVGGIYASLMPRHCKKYTGCNEVYKRIHKEAEKYAAANHLSYYILNNDKPVDYQIIHTSRGCTRKCDFCGTWKIEPINKFERSIKEKIQFRKLVFYDNNFLASPHIENILNELIELKKAKKIIWCESQSGFDGRELLEKPHLGKMIKRAGFRYPRIAWDWKYNVHAEIKRQIDIIVSAGYNSKNIFVFMLYNWAIPFKQMEKKRVKCWQWQVQIADCRYRPLTQTYDNYNPRKTEQTNKDYYIHTETGWSDALVKLFRKNVRRQNICVRQHLPFYSREFERKSVTSSTMKKVKHLRTLSQKKAFLRKKAISYWLPNQLSKER